MGQPSSKKNEMTIRHQFDRFCQKILHDEKVDYIREQEYRKQHEITLNEIPKKELDKVHTGSNRRECCCNQSYIKAL